MRRVRRRLALVGLGAATTIAALVRAGHRTLAGPADGGWGSVESWYDAVGAATAAVAALRLLAIGLAAWVLLAAGLQLLGTLSPLRVVRRLADAVSPQVLQRLAQGTTALAVTAVLAGPPTPPDRAGTAVMEVLDADGSTTSTTTSPTAPATTTPTAPPSAPAVPAPRPVPAPPPTPAPDQVVVAPGDSFWSLAVDAVAEEPGRGAVGDYWRHLIAANRARLVDPANPDLLYPGQVLTRPPS